VPSIWQKPTSASLDNLLQRTRKGASLEGIFDCIFSEDDETIDERQQQQPDSGLGSSHSEGRRSNGFSPFKMTEKLIVAPFDGPN
jgi:hypothetical protein